MKDMILSLFLCFIVVVGCEGANDAKTITAPEEPEEFLWIGSTDSLNQVSWTALSYQNLNQQSPLVLEGLGRKDSIRYGIKVVEDENFEDGTFGSTDTLEAFGASIRKINPILDTLHFKLVPMQKTFQRFLYKERNVVLYDYRIGGDWKPTPTQAEEMREIFRTVFLADFYNLSRRDPNLKMFF